MQYSQQSNQLLLMAAAIFVSVTAAVIVSTLLIMTLMRGEMASALSSHVTTAAPVTAQSTGCSVPANEVNATTTSASADTMPAEHHSYNSVAAPLYVAKYASVPVHTTNSFNNTNTTTMNTVNNVTNTEVKTVIKDSFNKDSYNDNSKTVKVTKDSNNTIVVKDNTVNVASNNNTSVNSGNTTTTNTTNNTTNTVTTNSNNTTTVGSNNPVVTNIENHLLSDNTVVVAPAL